MRARVSAKRIGFKMGPAATYIPAHTTTTEARTTSTRANEAGCRCCADSGGLVSRSLPSEDTNFYPFSQAVCAIPKSTKAKGETSDAARHTRVPSTGVPVFVAAHPPRHLTGSKTLLKPKKPTLTRMYSGSPLQFTKSFSTTPILFCRGSQSQKPAYSSGPANLWLGLLSTAAYDNAVPPFRASFLELLLDRLHLLLRSLLVINFLWSSCSSGCISCEARALTERVLVRTCATCFHPSITHRVQAYS